MLPEVSGKGIILTNGAYGISNAKTAHGLVRGSSRFSITAVVDEKHAGNDAGEVLDGKNRGIPIVPSLEEALSMGPCDFCVVGVATHGGVIPEGVRSQVKQAVNAGLSIVNGLHEGFGEDNEIVSLAQTNGVQLIDVRRPAKREDLHFWSGAILDVRIPVMAVLGTDCAMGKRTTARWIVEALQDKGVRSEMIYTGQTGWMQGAKFGFIFDSIPNDFVSGELEFALLSCAKTQPQLMVLEGQSSLRNPSGPCGTELLLSGQAKGVILQHVPSRLYFDGLESRKYEIPSIASEIQLIESYGSKVLGLSLSSEGSTPEELSKIQERWESDFGIPVAIPLAQGIERLVPAVQDYLGTRQ